MRQIHHWAALVFVGAIAAAPEPHLLHRRVPPAARAQLADRHRPRSAGAGRGLHRLLAARRPAVGHGPADRLLGDPVDPVRRAVAGVPGLRRRVPHARHHQPPVRAPRDPAAGLLIGGVVGAPGLIWSPEAHRSTAAPGARRTTSSGRAFWPGQVFRSVGLFFLTAAVVIAGSAGSFRSTRSGSTDRTCRYVATVPAQPDWYVGWLEGALRLGPALRADDPGRDHPLAVHAGLRDPGPRSSASSRCGR